MVFFGMGIILLILMLIVIYLLIEEFLWGMVKVAIVWSIFFVMVKVFC